MFGNLKKSLNTIDAHVASTLLLENMVCAEEDDILEEIITVEPDEKEINDLIKKIPDAPFANNEKITDQDLADADNEADDPTIDDLVDDMV